MRSEDESFSWVAYLASVIVAIREPRRLGGLGHIMLDLRVISDKMSLTWRTYVTHMVNDTKSHCMS